MVNLSELYTLKQHSSLSLHPCLYQRGSQFGSVYPRVAPSWWEPLAPGFTDEVLGHQQGSHLSSGGAEPRACLELCCLLLISSLKGRKRL